MKLVLLPGSDGTGRLFEPFLASMPSGVEVAVVAYPKHLYAIDDLARYALDAVGAAPCVLVAESYSGPVAIRMLALCPALFRGVVLCATFVSCPRPGLAKLASLIPARIFLLTGRIRFLARCFCFGFDSSKPILDLFDDVMARLPAQTLKGRLAVLASLALVVPPEDTGVPFFYLSPSNDRLIPSTAQTELKSVIKPSKVARIDGPHFLLQVKPLECWAAIMAFVATIR